MGKCLSIEFSDGVQVEVGTGAQGDDNDLLSKPSHRAQEKVKAIPVVILSGFLGAGKTTTLTHLLENERSFKIGVVANDVAQVNIDAKLVRDVATLGAGKENVKTVRLSNGCVCCTAEKDLESTFELLLMLGPFDVIVIESTGVAEPREVRKNFAKLNLGNIALRRMVTVVDSSAFLEEMDSADSLVRRPDLSGEPSSGTPPQKMNKRMVTDLLIEQVECADVILLNKSDTLDTDNERNMLARIISGLNPNARIEAAEWGKVSLDIFLDDLFEKSTVAQIKDIRTEHRNAVAGHRNHNRDENRAHGQGYEHRSHQHNQSESMTRAEARFGIRSFVYSRRKPFNASRLTDTVLRPMKSAQNAKIISSASAAEENDSSIIFVPVIRSKGFLWLSHKHDDMLYWSHAGKSFCIRPEGCWWASTPFEQWPTDPSKLEDVQSDFEGPYKDRRNEIVFITCCQTLKDFEANRDDIITALDASLLDEVEWEAFQAAHPLESAIIFG